MKTHKGAGATVKQADGNVVGMSDLEAPRNAGFVFKTRHGYGAECSCGWKVLAQSVAAVWEGMVDHQVPEYCIGARQAALEE